LSAFRDVGREDLVKLLAIYEADMKRFGYTWSVTGVTAGCAVRSNITAHSCC